MKEFTVAADAGCVAVKCGPMTAYFSNGFGDGAHTVYVTEKTYPPADQFNGWRFIETLDIGTDGEAWLLDYDCGGASPLHPFVKGWYTVYNRDGDVLFVRSQEPRMTPIN